MIYPVDKYFMKDWLVLMMSPQDLRVTSLLETLSVKELKILQNNKELISEVRKISRMEFLDLVTRLREEYGLDIDHLSSKDVAIVPDDVMAKAIPEGMSSNNGGWYLSVKDGEFTEWAKGFLLQEIRIEIWVRYLQYKSQKAKEQKLADELEDAMSSHMDIYPGFIY